MKSVIKQLILDFTMGKISREDFEQNENIQLQTNPNIFLDILIETIVNQDKDALEYLVMIIGVFDPIENYKPIIRKLIGENWHNQHENMVDILSKSIDINNTKSFYKILNSVYKYYKDSIEDFMVPIWVKCIWALGKIGTYEAKEYLSKLLNSDYQDVREAVSKQFEKNKWS